MGKLLDLLEGCCLGDREDEHERIWTLDVEKNFSLKSIYKALSHTDSQSLPNSFIWNNQIPSKVSFFMWEL